MMQRLRASELLAGYLEKWKQAMTRQLLGVLVGRARYFSSKTPEELSARGLHMCTSPAARRASESMASPVRFVRGEGERVCEAHRRKAKEKREAKACAELGLEREPRIGQGDLTGI